jgi:hypothetical protein
MSLSDQLTLTQSAFNEAMNKVEQARHGATTEMELFNVEVRLEQALHATKQYRLTLEAIDKEKRNIVV